MLARKTSSAFICLQCQLRLARPRQIPPIARTIPSSNFSSHSRLFSVDDEDAAEQRFSLRPKTVNPRPLGRLRGRRGKLVREGSAALGIESLGAPSEIIVLRDVNDNTSEDIPELLESKKTEPLKQADILASLQNENVTLAEGELNKQIESLRPQHHSSQIDPKDPIYVSQAEFRNIYNSLYNGFTAAQLSRYFAESTGVAITGVKKEVLQGLIKGVKKEVLQGLIKGVKSKQPVYQTAWNPGTSDIAKRLPAGNVVTQRKGKTATKIILADQILRKCWNVLVLEEIESPGEIEVSMKRWQLSLLSAGVDSTALDRIGQARNARIEIYWPHNIIRITADKSTAEYAAQDIEARLKESVSVTFALERWRSLLPEHQRSMNFTQLFREEDFTRIEKMTGANVHVLGNSLLMIRGLDRPQVQEATRCLFAMMHIHQPTSSTAIVNARASHLRKHSVIHPVALENLLDYRDRNLDLGRLTYAVTRSPAGKEPDSRSLGLAAHTLDIPGQAVEATELVATTETVKPSEAVEAAEDVKATPALKAIEAVEASKAVEATQKVKADKLSVHQSQVLRAMFRLPFPFKPPPQSPINSSSPVAIWGSIIHTEYSAKIGHILYPIGGEAAGISRLVSSGVPQKDPASAFASTIPGLSRLIADPAISQSDQPNLEILDYSFVSAPSEYSDSDLRKTYPRLSLRMLINPHGNARLAGMAIMLDHHFIDVSLPNRVVDIRFKKQQYLWIRFPKRSRAINSHSEWISKNIDSGDRLIAPPVLKLRIPKWTILDPDRPIEENGEELVPVDCLFTGAEHRQTVKMAFEDQCLVYAGVQAGQLGGRRGELELFYSTSDKNKENVQRENERDILAKYIKSSFHLADLVNKSAANRLPLEEMPIAQKPNRNISNIVFRKLMSDSRPWRICPSRLRAEVEADQRSREGLSSETDVATADNKVTDERGEAAKPSAEDTDILQRGPASGYVGEEDTREQSAPANYSTDRAEKPRKAADTS
ncbi:hypothetical protein K432DRAFT_428534 [Lepidopterella palustris CBS 459.81]|uniref:Uncharacterized protein n=1 Tax=Lepidopterella palustris CBS 459.81 TaxID=1314670 RepID=A0A8E2E3R4_9PEZI|nr:hypothetical protein K432DRAFT_428534 [Lepidopterella palustris CBS 459.81]